MKLYSCKPAPNPRRVLKFIAEKGIDIPVEEVDLRNQAHLQTDFLKLNPRAEVPVLELDDGTAISESIAICFYLEGEYPEPPLFGRNPKERGLVSMWQRRIELNGVGGVGEAFRNTSPMFKDRGTTGTIDFPQIPQLAERGRVRAENFMDELNDQLSGGSWIAGERFSIADIEGAIFIDFAAWIELVPADNHTHTQRWLEQMTERPSAKI